MINLLVKPSLENVSFLIKFLLENQIEYEQLSSPSTSIPSTPLRISHSSKCVSPPSSGEPKKKRTRNPPLDEATFLKIKQGHSMGYSSTVIMYVNRAKTFEEYQKTTKERIARMDARIKERQLLQSRNQNES